jgi:hypothetical protein
MTNPALNLKKDGKWFLLCTFSRTIFLQNIMPDRYDMIKISLTLAYKFPKNG